MSRPLQVSLVIPVRNEEQSLPALVQSILAQTRRPDEVVIVDGGSSDRTLEVARQLTHGDERFRVLEAGPATPGRGRNCGIAAATHDWVALTDAGIRLDPAWLERLTRVAEQGSGVQVVYGNYEPATTTWFERCAALAYVPPKQARPPGRMRGPSIASALVHREAWRKVGGFPDLRAAEDLIFMERLEQHGCKVGWAPDATVIWQLQPTLGRTFQKFVLYSRHNVWAGRQRYWHHGVARQYLFVLVILILSMFHNSWWLGLAGAWLLGRTFKNLWVRREGRGLRWLLNPFRLMTVALITVTIDAATFYGWIQAKLWPPPTSPDGSSKLRPSGE